MKQFDRLISILELLLKPNVERPTRVQIMRHLGDKAKTVRTFRRDLVDLRENFGISVRPNDENRYEIVSSNEEVRKNILMLINAQRSRELLLAFQDDAYELNKYVVVDNPGGIGGEWVTELLEHCRNRNSINIVHKAHWRDETMSYTLQPYQLREYEKQWYLIAWVSDKNRFQSFGLDRILEVFETGEQFERVKEKELSDLFDYMVGIWGYEYRPIEIKVWFDKKVKNYIKSSPWHWTQNILTEDDDGMVVRWSVTNNPELRRKLLGWSGQFEVLKPQELRAQMFELTNKAATMNKVVL